MISRITVKQNVVFLAISIVKNVSGILNEVFLLLEQNPVLVSLRLSIIFGLPVVISSANDRFLS